MPNPGLRARSWTGHVTVTLFQAARLLAKDIFVATGLARNPVVNAMLREYELSEG